MYLLSLESTIILNNFIATTPTYQNFISISHRPKPSISPPHGSLSYNKFCMNIIYKYAHFPPQFRYILEQLQRNQINVKSIQNEDAESEALVQGVKQLLFWMSRQLVCTQVWFEVLEKFLELFKLALLPYTRGIFTIISKNPQLTHTFTKTGHKLAFMVTSMIRQIGHGTDLSHFNMYVQKSVLSLLSRDLLYYNGQDLKLSQQDLRFYRFIARSRKWATRCMNKMKFTVDTYWMREELAEYEELKREEEFISETFLDDLNQLEFNLLKSGTVAYFSVKPIVQTFLQKAQQNQYQRQSVCSPPSLSLVNSVPIKQYPNKCQQHKELPTVATNLIQQTPPQIQKPNQDEQLQEGEMQLQEGEMSMDDIYYSRPTQIQLQEAKQPSKQPQDQIIELTKEEYECIMQMRQGNKVNPKTSNLYQSSSKIQESSCVAKAVSKVQPKKEYLASKHIFG